jgi:hypothetical protein
VPSAVGIAVVAACGLVAVVWNATSDATSPVIVLARDVARGTVLAGADLRVERVRVPGAVPTIAPQDARRLLGRIATVDLPAGTLVSASLLADRPAATGNERVVGLALGAGETPLRLRRGDRVDVIRTPTAGTGVAPAPEVLVTGAVIADVETADDPQRTVRVGVIVPAVSAPVVAAAMANRQLRLVGAGAPDAGPRGGE